MNTNTHIKGSIYRFTGPDSRAVHIQHSHDQLAALGITEAVVYDEYGYEHPVLIDENGMLQYYTAKAA